MNLQKIIAKMEIKAHEVTPLFNEHLNKLLENQVFGSQIVETLRENDKPDPVGQLSVQGYKLLLNKLTTSGVETIFKSPNNTLVAKCYMCGSVLATALFFNKKRGNYLTGGCCNVCFEYNRMMKNQQKEMDIVTPADIETSEDTGIVPSPTYTSLSVIAEELSNQTPANSLLINPTKLKDFLDTSNETLDEDAKEEESRCPLKELYKHEFVKINIMKEPAMMETLDDLNIFINESLDVIDILTETVKKVYDKKKDVILAIGLKDSLKKDLWQAVDKIQNKIEKGEDLSKIKDLIKSLNK